MPKNPVTACRLAFAILLVGSIAMIAFALNATTQWPEELANVGYFARLNENDHKLVVAGIDVAAQASRNVLVTAGAIISVISSVGLIAAVSIPMNSCETERGTE